MSLFDCVVDEYDAARPGYPRALFDALGPLGGLIAVEGGCGTGLATRRLMELGATVIGVDVGANMLRRAIVRAPGLRALRADAARLPISDQCVDLLCFAQSWHWMDERLRVGEARRVLRPEGRWAAWWSHARADGAAWFDAYWDLIEACCPGTLRSQRDIDWSKDLTDSGLFAVDPDTPAVFPWTREIGIESWLVDHRSHSNVAVLGEDDRRQLLARLRALLEQTFPDGVAQPALRDAALDRPPGSGVGPTAMKEPEARRPPAPAHDAVDRPNVGTNSYVHPSTGPSSTRM